MIDMKNGCGSLGLWWGECQAIQLYLGRAVALDLSHLSQLSNPILRHSRDRFAQSCHQASHFGPGMLRDRTIIMLRRILMEDSRTITLRTRGKIAAARLHMKRSM